MEYERSLVKRFKGLPIELVGVNFDFNERDVVLKQYQKAGCTWPSFFFGGSNWVRRIPVATSGIPSFFLLDKDGNVKAVNAALKTEILPVAESLLREMGHADVSLLTDDERKNAEGDTDLQKSAAALLTQQAITAMQSRVSRGESIDDRVLESWVPEDFDDRDKAIQFLQSRRLQLYCMIASEQAFTLMDDIATLDSASELNQAGWFVVQVLQQGISLDPRLVESTRRVLKKAGTLEPNNPSVLDSVAQFVYYADGDIDEAIRLQEKAGQAAADDEALQKGIQEFLERLRKERDSQE